MNKIYSNNYPIINLYKKASSKSEIVTQMIYGERFEIIKKLRKWLKIKIKEDRYNGYIRKQKVISYSKATHKVSVLSAKIYKNTNSKNQIKNLPYGSKLKILNKHPKFSRFQNHWIETKTELKKSVNQEGGASIINFLLKLQTKHIIHP